ncbi:MAG: 2-hydroxychromene-2-carboxylate isomerase [Burkholderiales bacterium]|nr:2-hydroxychromene-2-carboxylate isomerase [Burkholderiales bacterium]
MRPIEFYFDFSSSYGYLGSTRIDGIAANYGRQVVWKPILLGAALKVTGLPPLPAVPLKGDYSRRDFARSARYYGVPYKQPSVFPIATQAPARAFYWLDAQDRPKAKRLAAALYEAYFTRDVNISNPADTIAIAASMGVDAAALEAALNDPAVKDKLKSEVEQGIARGVFGSPFVFVDDEPFWGVDRFDQIERWLREGGF